MLENTMFSLYLKNSNWVIPWLVHCMLSFHLQKIQVIRKWQVLDPSLDSNLKIVEFYKILKRTIKINPQRCNLQSEFLTQYYTILLIEFLISDFSHNITDWVSDFWYLTQYYWLSFWFLISSRTKRIKFTTIISMPKVSGSKTC